MLALKNSNTKRPNQMNSVDSFVIACLKATFAFIASAWAGFPIAIHLLAIFVGIDMISALVAAGIRGQLSSTIGLKGLLQKLAIVIALVFVHELDQATGLELGLARIFAFYLITNECISIVENLANCGVSFPQPVISALAKLKQTSGKAATPAQLEQLASDMRDSSGSTK